MTQVALAANNATYYVSTGGNDGNSGSEISPFRTIQKAVDVAKAGDTIYVREGTYHEQVVIQQSGTSASPIRLLAYPDELPVIDGRYSLPSGEIAGCSDVAPKHCFVYTPLVSLNGNFIEFSGFKIIRSQGRGIGVNPTSSNDFVRDIVVDRCVIDGARNAPINIQDAKNVTVQNCDVTNGANYATHSRSASTLNWPVIVNTLRSDNVVIRQNEIHENWGEGVAAGRDSTNITIEDNIIYDNYALQIYVHRAQGVLVQRNLVYHTNASSFQRGGNPSDCIVVNNEGSFMSSLVTEQIQITNNVVTGCGRGIAVWGNGGLNILTKAIEISHNTIVNTVKNNSDAPVGIFVNARVPLKDILIQKNIVLQDTGHSGYMPSDNEIIVNRNLWSSAPTDSATSPTDHIGDPLLNNPDRTLSPGKVQINWFKPKENSPAAAKGIGPTEYLDQASFSENPPASSPVSQPEPQPTTPVPDPAVDEEVDPMAPDAYYNFDEAVGTHIGDKSGSGQRLHLTIENEAAVEWHADGLMIQQPTTIRTAGSAASLMNTCSSANELSVSIWVTPANVTQDGPARILSLSSDATNRNFMIGQGLWGDQATDLLTMRLRTTQTNSNGEPSFESPPGTIQPRKHHIVYSRDNKGNAKLYVDGKLSASATQAGALSNWDASYDLLLANEASGDRPWLGTYHQLAIYCGALTKEDAAQLYSIAENFPLPSIQRPSFFSTIFLPIIGQ